MAELMPVDELIDLLGLEPLPVEGGFFRRWYLAADLVDPSLIDQRYSGRDAECGKESRDRKTPLCGAIYYLITPESFSAMHKLNSDEVWHFYFGDPIEQLLLFPDGHHERAVLGNDLRSGLRPAAAVPAGVWQGTRLLPGGRYALCGTTMSPAYRDEDFTAGSREALEAGWPEAAGLIEELVHD